MSIEKEREAFEAWAEREYSLSLQEPDNATLSTWGGERYGNRIVKGMFMAWLARAAIAGQGVPVAGLDVTEFARRAGLEMEKHDFHGFEPVALAVAEEVLLSAAPSAPAANHTEDSLAMVAADTVSVPRPLLERLIDPYHRVPQNVHMHNADCQELRALLRDGEV